MRKSIVSDAEMCGFRTKKRSVSTYNQAATLEQPRETVATGCGWLREERRVEECCHSILWQSTLSRTLSGAGVTDLTLENGGLKRCQNPPVSAAIFPETRVDAEKCTPMEVHAYEMHVYEVQRL
jgi:hypothetical protein